MSFLLTDWFLGLAGLALLGVGVYGAYSFFRRPTGERIKAVKDWLLYATAQAEKELGSGTGQLKLRQVYDLFLQRFPAVSGMVSFETFSGWVDEALERMKKLLATNTAFQNYVEGRETK